MLSFLTICVAYSWLSRPVFTAELCSSSENSTVVESAWVYHINVLFRAEGLEAWCPSPRDPAECSAFSDFIDEVMTESTNRQCYLEAYKSFDVRGDQFSNHCTFDEMESLCPNATVLPYAVNGGYGPWSNWSSCDCYDTEETRTRDCDNPVPANDGFTCAQQALGDASETRPCTTTTTQFCTTEGAGVDTTVESTTESEGDVTSKEVITTAEILGDATSPKVTTVEILGDATSHKFTTDDIKSGTTTRPDAGVVEQTTAVAGENDDSDVQAAIPEQFGLLQENDDDDEENAAPRAASISHWPLLVVGFLTAGLLYVSRNQ